MEQIFPLLMKVEIVVECRVHRSFLVPHPIYFGIVPEKGRTSHDWAIDQVVKEIKIPNDAAVICDQVDWQNSKIYEVL